MHLTTPNHYYYCENYYYSHFGIRINKNRQQRAHSHTHSSQRTKELNFQFHRMANGKHTTRQAVMAKLCVISRIWFIIIGAVSAVQCIACHRQIRQRQNAFYRWRKRNIIDRQQKMRAIFLSLLLPVRHSGVCVCARTEVRQLWHNRIDLMKIAKVQPPPQPPTQKTV